MLDPACFNPVTVHVTLAMEGVLLLAPSLQPISISNVFLSQVPRDLVCFDSNLPCGFDLLCAELKLSLADDGKIHTIAYLTRVEVTHVCAVGEQPTARHIMALLSCLWSNESVRSKAFSVCKIVTLCACCRVRQRRKEAKRCSGWGCKRCIGSGRQH
jgi:hypothetical protein